MKEELKGSVPAVTEQRPEIENSKIAYISDYPKKPQEETSLNDFGIEFGELIPLKHNLYPVIRLTEDKLPEPIRALAVEYAEIYSVPLDFPAVTLLQTIASVAGTRFNIYANQSKTHSVCPNLWGLLVGDVGTRKTTVIQNICTKYMTDLQTAIDHRYAEKYGEKLGFKKPLLAAHKKERFNETDERMSNELYIKQKQYESEIDNVPDKRTLKIDVATEAKLKQMCSTNPYGVLCLKDDVPVFIKEITTNNSESKLSFYKAGYDTTQNYFSCRISSGNTLISFFSLTLFGGARPKALIELSNDYKRHNLMDTMNMFQLAVYPDNAKRQLSSKQINELNVLKMKDILNSLVFDDFSNVEVDDRTAHKHYYFKFSDDAQAIYDKSIMKLWDRIELEPSEAIKNHLKGSGKLLASLALLFHIINITPEGLESAISADNMNLAVWWADYLESHARRIYGLMGEEVDTVAQRIFSKILYGKLPDTFKIYNITHNDWSGLKDEKQISKALDVLEQHNYVKKIKHERKPNQMGRPQDDSYYINPTFWQSE